MPNSCCFSYPADVPPGIGNRPAAQPAPPGLRWMSTTSSTCFKYPAGMPRSMSFSGLGHSADVPPATKVPDAAQPALPGLRRMPNMCFRY